MNDLLSEYGLLDAPVVQPPKSDQRVYLEFQKPSDLLQYEPPVGFELVGNFHIQKGAPFVIGGAPGVGKSRAAVALAVAGATGQSWFGLKVHRHFKTMILQTENGRVRLKNEFLDIPCQGLDDFVRICPPPPYGFAFDRPEFRFQLRQAIEDFQPDVFLLDPFNRLAQDDKVRDYRQAFEDLMDVLPTGEAAPALGIVAHTRKPKDAERSNGRSALSMLAGSYLLGSVPRTVFIMQSATDETTESRVLWHCCKNNDGELGVSSVWERGNGLFKPVTDFDWSELNGSGEGSAVITEEDLATLFEHGRRRLARSQAVRDLIEQTGCKRSAAYNALKLNGRFAARLVEDANELLTWNPGT